MDNQEFNPPAEQKPHRSKLVYVLIVILILGLGGIGGYLLGTKNTENSIPNKNAFPIVTLEPVITSNPINWVTYTNNKYGYSVNYPVDFEVKEQESDIFIFQSLFESLQSTERPWGNFMVEVTKKAAVESEKSVIDYRTWRVVGHISDKISKESRLKVAGYESVRLDYETLENNPLLLTTVIVFGDNYNYSLIGKRELIDQALSTFKFLPQGSPVVTDETARWKTYADSEYRLSIRYPSDWKFNETKSNNPDPNSYDRTATFESPIIKMTATTYPLMNECMKVSSQESINLNGIDFVKKYYQGVDEGAMCGGGNHGSERQVWVTPTRANYGYNFQFNYDSINIQEAEKLINQILSTFQFL